VDEFDFEGQEMMNEKKKKKDSDNKVAIHQKVVAPSTLDPQPQTLPNRCALTLKPFTPFARFLYPQT